MLIIIFYLLTVVITVIQCFQRLSNNIKPNIRIVRSINELIHGDQTKLFNNVNVIDDSLGINQTSAHIWYDLENAVEDNKFLTFPRSELYLITYSTVQKLFIRESYETVFNYIKSDIEYDNLQRFLVTGTPGIGKSVFAYYAIREFIKLTTNKTNEFYYGRQILYQYEPKIIYWIRQDGTFKIRSNRLFDYLLSNSRNILFCDMISPVEPDLCNGVTIVTCSPDSRRYKEFVKPAHSRYILNPFTKQEMLQLYKSSYADKIPRKTFNDLYSMFGGIPRNVLEDHRNAPLHMQIALNNAKENIISIMNAMDRDDSIIYRLINIRSDTLKYANTRLSFASPYVEKFFLETFEIETLKEINNRVKFSTDLDPSEQSFVGTSNSFKELCHGIIRKSGIDELLRLQKYSRTTKSNSISQYGNTETENWLNSSYVKYLISTSFYNVSEVEIKENVYYKPENKNLESLDSFLIINDRFFGFLITTAEKHDIKIPGLVNVLVAILKSNLTNVKEYHLVFVQPKQAMSVTKKSISTFQKFIGELNITAIGDFKNIPDLINQLKINQWIGLIDVDKTIK
mmetsp:Transcript_14956/g.13513  ORF Transcript_14956/g.13513 Transcript_14956/m.13513 type:complete len:569 (+) Transcript_14956:44-1750(+)